MPLFSHVWPGSSLYNFSPFYDEEFIISIPELTKGVCKVDEGSVILRRQWALKSEFGGKVLFYDHDMNSSLWTVYYLVGTLLNAFHGDVFLVLDHKHVRCFFYSRLVDEDRLNLSSGGV